MLISIQPLYLELIRLGKKTVEGRLLRPKYKGLRVGQAIRFGQKEVPGNYVDTQITKLSVYPSFEAMLQTEGLNACLPGISHLTDALAIYHSFPDYQQQERILGVLAIGIIPYVASHSSSATSR